MSGVEIFNRLNARFNEDYLDIKPPEVEPWSNNGIALARKV